MINKAKAYFQSMNARDKRAVIFAAVTIAAIVLYLFIALPLFEDWTRIRRETKEYHTQLESISSRSAASKAKLAGLYQTVPFLELPQKEDLQRKLFWDKTYDQLKKAGIGIKSGPSYVSSGRRKTTQGPPTLKLNFSGSCKYDQLVKLLAQLNENPFLVGIEELTIESDEKKPEQVTIEMTLETFVKQELR